MDGNDFGSFVVDEEFPLVPPDLNGVVPDYVPDPVMPPAVFGDLIHSGSDSIVPYTIFGEPVVPDPIVGDAVETDSVDLEFKNGVPYEDGVSDVEVPGQPQCSSNGGDVYIIGVNGSKISKQHIVLSTFR